MRNNGLKSTPSSEFQSDAHLVALAKIGDEQAFTELWGRHGAKVRGVIWRIVRNREDAEDILQEAYLKSFVHVVSFNGDSQFSTWLSRIGINLALMLLREKRRCPEVVVDAADPNSTARFFDFPDPADSIEARCLHAERRQHLRLAIQQLPPKLRLMVQMQNWEELPLDEIAQRTGISMPAVKARLARARTALRRLTANSSRPRSPWRCNANQRTANGAALITEGRHAKKRLHV